MEVFAKNDEGRTGIKNKAEKRKRGRKRKDEKEVYFLKKDQSKFFIDLSKDEKELELVQELLVKSNKKDYGKEITIKELALAGLAKLTSKDVDKLQENSLSEMEKVQRTLEDYNKKNKTNLDLGEFLVKKLNIS